MNTFIVLTTLVSIALSLGQLGKANSIANQAGKRRGELFELAKEISAKIAGNNNLINKLQNAATNEQTDLLNAIYRGMGFGARMESLQKSIQESRDNVQKKIDKLNKENVEYQKKIDDINTANSNLGISDELNAKYGAEKTTLGKIKDKIGQTKFGGWLQQGKQNINDFLNQNQNINGGITNV